MTDVYKGLDDVDKWAHNLESRYAHARINPALYERIQLSPNPEVEGRLKQAVDARTQAQAGFFHAPYVVEFRINEPKKRKKRKRKAGRVDY